MSLSDTSRPSSAEMTRIGSFRAAWAALFGAPDCKRVFWPVVSGTSVGKPVGLVGRIFFAMGHAGLGRTFIPIGLAGLVGGCFQPLYAEHPLPVGAAGNPGVVGQLRAVDVAAIDAPAGSRLARVSVNVRNELIYDLTGGGGGFSPTHRLDVKLVATQLQVIVDINTARPDVNNYGIDSTYTLTELATGRVVVKGQTFARVSYNIPGQEQRFAGERGLRDAENRAAKEIAENIRSRLASFFVAGT